MTCISLMRLLVCIVIILSNADISVARNLIVLDRGTPLEIGMSFEGAREDSNDVSLIQFSQRIETIRWWEAGLSVKYRPTSRYAISLSTGRFQISRDAHLISPIDAVPITRHYHVDSRWQPIRVDGQYYHNMSSGRSWIFSAGIDLCHNLRCPVTLERVTATHTMIHDPLAFSIAVGGINDTGGDGDHKWYPVVSGTVEFVVNAAFATSTTMTSAFQDGRVSGVALLHTFSWRIGDKLHAWVGMRQRLFEPDSAFRAGINLQLPERPL